MLYGAIPCPNLFGSSSANQKQTVEQQTIIVPIFVDTYLYIHMYVRLIFWNHCCIELI